MKACSVCSQTKPLDGFGVRSASPDGRTAACRDCLKERDRARYPKERSTRLRRMRDYAAGPGKDKCNAAKRNWIERNQEKRAAHILLNNALRSGRIERKPCEVCESPDTEAHHDDYTKPLDVRWLCDEHHKQHHHQEG